MISKKHSQGFSLIEAVLAIGIFFVTVLVLIGMLGPLLNSVNDVETTDEVVSVVESLNSFLQVNSEFAIQGSNFDLIYQAVRTRGYATVYVFRNYLSSKSTQVKLSVGFSPNETATTIRMARNAKVYGFKNAAGPIYRAILTLSPFLRRDYYRDRGRSAIPRYTLLKSSVDYEGNFLPLNIDIYVNPPGPSFRDSMTYKELLTQKPIFTYTTAINR